jgi:ParB family chromosome partitioning protein
MEVTMASASTTPPTTPDDAPAPTASDPAAPYREVPLAELAANPLNPRRKLADIDELADSVRAVGIVEPLLVTPSTKGHGALVIVAGHRRLAAAHKAGLSAVPCVIRALDEVAIVQAALVENSHRQNLTYTEEAEQLQRLVDLTALKVGDIAKSVGRSAAYVTGRLALLTLPDIAHEVLDEGTISLDTAQQLADVADYPEIIADLFDDDGHLDAYLLAEARARVEIERETTRLAEEATAKGLRLLADPRDPDDPGLHPLDQGYSYLATLDLSPQQQAAHRRQSCHAVWIDLSFGKPRLIPVCTDPARHRKPAQAAGPAITGTQDDPPDTGTSQPDRQLGGTAAAEDRWAANRRALEERKRAEDERARNRKRVARARRDFLAHAAERRIKRAEAAVFVFGSVISQANTNQRARVGKLLGLNPGTDRWDRPEWSAAVAEYAAQSSDHLLKAALLVACSWAEDRIGPYGSYDEHGERYLHALAALGYEPDPYETEEITAHRRRADERRDKGLADGIQPASGDGEPDQGDGDRDNEH